MSVTTAISRHGITLPTEQVAEFCRRWKIRELAVFGSFLRDDFRPDSDLDFLYTFDDDAQWTLFDLVAMDQELAAIVGRPVDLVDRRSIEKSENWIRRRSILGTAEAIYAAG
jgi:predicted nucleotidyltransferase